MTKKQRFLELVKIYSLACKGKTYFNEKGEPLCVNAERITKVVHRAIYLSSKKIPGKYDKVLKASIDFTDWVFSDFNPQQEPSWATVKDFRES